MLPFQQFWLKYCLQLYVTAKAKALGEAGTIIISSDLRLWYKTVSTFLTQA